MTLLQHLVNALNEHIIDSCIGSSVGTGLFVGEFAGAGWPELREKQRTCETCDCETCERELCKIREFVSFIKHY